MARLIMSALELGGHKIALASDFRSYEGTGDPVLQQGMATAGRIEAEHIIETCLSRPPQNRPNVWFTYHLYYKAPDHIGPAVSKALNIPYVVAEPSHAPKRSEGPWADSHHTVTRALETTDCAFCLTKHDMACVEPVLHSPERLVYLPPFLDSTPFSNGRTQKDGCREALYREFGLTADILLVAVGMLRKGDKFQSFKMLAESLDHLGEEHNWQLIIVGDGERADEIKDLFLKRNSEPNRVIFAGEQPGGRIPEFLAAGDIYVWPAVGEAYGMALLEAQASGLPVVAGDERGVPDVVLRGQSAFLTPPGDVQAFAGAIRQLMADGDMRLTFGEKAADFATQRSLQNAADILNRGLEMAVNNRDNKS